MHEPISLAHGKQLKKICQRFFCATGHIDIIDDISPYLNEYLDDVMRIYDISPISFAPYTNRRDVFSASISERHDSPQPAGVARVDELR
jgi:hypothetical protein